MIACAPARKNVVIYDKCEKPGLIEGSNIETITLGKNTNDWYVNSLDRSFIGVMPNLKKITVKKGNKRYFTRDGVLFMRSGDGSNNGICLVKYPSSAIGWTPDWHPGHVVICSRANSTAHRYAIENGLVWEELS